MLCFYCPFLQKTLTDKIESDHNLQLKDELSKHASISDSSLSILSATDSLQVGSSSQIPASLKSDPDQSRTSVSCFNQNVSCVVSVVHVITESLNTSLLHYL